MSEDFVCEAFLTIYIITFLIGFPGTVLALCSCIRKIASKPIPIDLLMLNLAISDLIFLSFLPFKMKEAADQMTWNMPQIFCQLSLFMFLLPFYSSGLFLTVISTERYVCVAFPAKYKSPKRIIYTIITCVAIWVLVVGYSVLPYKVLFTDSLVADNTTNQRTLMAEPQSCYRKFTKEQLKELLPVRLSIAMLFFFLPLLICCFFYVSFIRILTNLPLIKRQRKLRAIGLVVGTLLVFTTCFAPYNASHLVGFIKKESPAWGMKALMLSTLNVCYDQIIFFCISREMRRTIKVCAKASFQFCVYLKREVCC
ncbi:free fatty acid receptor 2 [Danio aesculapii]|uniref:free fatty acid receptor 2 n=1 Tax=Danio aesculapii TaxID=1142201 RepID=UPI0024C048D8|nr:free fatty acid receptor 2 [Danio aesculapii]